MRQGDIGRAGWLAGREDDLLMPATSALAPCLDWLLLCAGGGLSVFGALLTALSVVWTYISVCVYIYETILRRYWFQAPCAAAVSQVKDTGLGGISRVRAVLNKTLGWNGGAHVSVCEGVGHCLVVGGRVI